MSAELRYREWPLYCRCDRCHDHLTVYLWIRKGAKGIYDGMLEGSTDVKKSLDGQIMHAHNDCGGTLRAVEPLPGPTRLV